jgi:hypothetical protein
MYHYTITTEDTHLDIQDMYLNSLDPDLCAAKGVGGAAVQLLAASAAVLLGGRMEIQ